MYIDPQLSLERFKKGLCFKCAKKIKTHLRCRVCNGLMCKRDKKNENICLHCKTYGLDKNFQRYKKKPYINLDGFQSQMTRTDIGRKQYNHLWYLAKRKKYTMKAYKFNKALEMLLYYQITSPEELEEMLPLMEELEVISKTKLEANNKLMNEQIKAGTYKPKQFEEYVGKSDMGDLKPVKDKLSKFLSSQRTQGEELLNNMLTDTKKYHFSAYREIKNELKAIEEILTDLN